MPIAGEEQATSAAPQQVMQRITETASGPVDLRRLQQVLAIDETTLRVAVSMLERCELLHARL